VHVDESNEGTPVACPDLGGHPRNGVGGPVSAALLRGQGGDLLGAPARGAAFHTVLAELYPSKTRGLRYDRDTCGDQAVREAAAPATMSARSLLGVPACPLIQVLTLDL